MNLTCRFTPRFFTAASAFILVLSLAPSSQAQIGTISSVVVTGVSAPGASGGVFSSLDNSFGLPVLNDLGQAAFTGALFGSTGGAGTDTGIFRGTTTAGSLVQIAREGGAAPASSVGTGGTLADLFARVPSLNDSGQVAFYSTVNGSTSDVGIFRGDGTQTIAIVRNDDDLPIPVGKFSDFNQPVINNAGQVAFSASLTGTFGGASDDFGVFRGSGGAVSQIVREGQAAPGGTGILRDFQGVTLNSAGQVAFQADVNNVGSGFNNGIYRGDGVGITIMAVEGQATPNGSGSTDGTFVHTSLPSLNDSGQVAFQANLTGGTTGSSPFNNVGVYKSDGSAFTQVAREGRAAPDGNGALNDTQLNYTVDNSVVNSSGQVAFKAELRGTIGGVADDTGLFRGDGTAFIQAAREGQAAPGGGTFQEFQVFAFNDANQIAFLADIDLGNGGTEFDSVGLFLADPTLGVIEIVRSGGALFGNTVTALSFAGTTTAGGDETSGLNNLGQVAFRFELADTRGGVAIWVVPEPGTASFLAGAAVILSLRRRRSIP